MSTTGVGIVVDGVSLAYGANVVLRDISLSIAPASSSRCWGRPGPASRRCCASSPASIRRAAGG